METNDFLAKIKANGNSKDWVDLAKVYGEYKSILAKLSTKDKGTFSLNVLCLLCRNLDKIPSWKDAVDFKELLVLSIDCVRETRRLDRADQVKTLACVYHVHRHTIKKNTPIPPELVIKLSLVVFETDADKLLREFCKTYFNILADRLSYIEKLKGKSVHKLLPKLTEDILNTIEIYDTVQFCKTALVFLVKKLHLIYSENNSEQLNLSYGQIFNKLAAKNDIKTFNKLNEDSLLDLYKKISDCLYVVADNASKCGFKNSSFSTAVRASITLLGNQPAMFHCLQTFYLNSFCDLFENRTSYTDTVFKNLTTSCKMTEKLGYKTTMLATYVYLNQFFRLFIESGTNIKENFTAAVQENCLNFMLKILSKLKDSQQLLKCENCEVKTGLHDALRLSFLLKSFITNSINYSLDITSLTALYTKVIDTQYKIMYDLTKLGCANSKKFYLKLQTDTHNIAILLNKHEYSISLFDIYIKNELSNRNDVVKHRNDGNRNETEFKNISRAFYNKSICELDFKKNEIALLDAYLSLIFAEDLKSEKHMSLVMDIKVKSLKDDTSDDDSDQNDHLQMLSVADARKIVLQKGLYGDMRAYLKDVKFSCLLKHEFLIYMKLWPSVLPIAGVWRSLLQLLEGRETEWMTVEDEETVLWTLLEVVSLTPTAVRSIHNDHFKEIVSKLLQKIDKIPDPVPVDVRVVQTTLLFLKAEYDIAATSLKHGWKNNEPSTDPDQVQLTRTVQHEHDALQSALQAVEIWTEVAMEINAVTKTLCLQSALNLAEIFVHHLLYFSRPAHGLQLAHVCCLVAQHTGQKEAFIRNVGILVYHISTPDVLEDSITQAMESWRDVALSEGNMEAALTFLSELSIYYHKCDSKGIAAKLLQLAQAKILQAYEKDPQIILDLAVGRLLEAQAMMCKNSGLSLMTDVNGLQRHYLSICNKAPQWCPRRLRSVRTQCGIASSTARCARASSALALYRRSRAASAAALSALNAVTVAFTCSAAVNAHNMQLTQVTIDNRLKYIMGLPTEQPTSIAEPKVEMFAPKQELEVMLESQHIKSLSPTRKYVQIPGFTKPDFLKHNNCNCYACDNIFCTIISYIIGGLEASMYFRANETEIANNYYKGVINSFENFNSKLKFVINKYDEMDFQKYIINHIKKTFEDEFKIVKLEILIEATYFELRTKNFDNADEYLVSVYEVLQDIKNPDDYMSNEVTNLVIASARMRNIVKKQDFNLEIEFENLKLSPKGEIPKTPISKPIVPAKSSKKPTIKDEEIPKKRKVIKLNLDKNSLDERDQVKPKTRKPVFKIPVPITNKPVLENITPRKTRKPAITITEATETPKTEATETPKTGTKDKLPEFFTPQSTPEQFFTPMTSIKTYSKSNLRKGIVKNLEEEFSTPVGKEIKGEKSLQVTMKSGRKEEKDECLQKSTISSKLVTSEAKARPRRLRQPNLNEN